jgi:DedD protein
VVGVTPVRQGKFALQLGAFSTQVNANRLQASLRKADITSYVETIKTPQGERFRLRAGPYHDRPAAERVRERLRGLGYDSSVVSL